ncbi:MAG: 2TM domain-containing protein [Anaerolineae bacterium]|nr:2TM domain-containing protein [Anaerolineae bacterium]
MSEIDKDYRKEIRKRMTERYNARAEFVGHLVAFIISMAVLWGPLSPQGGWATLALLISGGWFMGVVIHAVNMLMAELRERAIDAAIERERAWRGAYPAEPAKAKRDRLTRLSSDGELLEVIEDQWDEEQPARKRQS